MQRSCYVYIMTNKRHSVLYVGMTNDLERRVCEHKQKTINGFTCRYNVDQLVYFEHDMDPSTAIMREKQIKNYPRWRKGLIIGKAYPDWKDLSADWCINP